MARNEEGVRELYYAFTMLAAITVSLVVVGGILWFVFVILSVIVEATTA